MCAWGVTWRPPRAPSRDPELPTLLSQLGPSLEKGHHEQPWLGGTRGAKTTSLALGDSQTLPKMARGARGRMKERSKGEPRDNCPWGC